MRAQVLPAARIRGVKTGGCPHTAIRENASINLAATFSPELADLSIYVIDTAAGQDIPRKRGPPSPAPTSSSLTKPTSPPMSATI